jgi:hypothetical protein
MRCRTVLLRLVAWVAVAGWPVASLGQVRIDRDQPPLAIDAKTRDEVIDAALKHLADNYVFPDVAEKMARAVRQRREDKQYDGVKTGQDLARLLTEHLQEVSRDKHLRVNCTTKKLPPMPKGGPSKERRALMRERMKKTNAGFKKAERLPGNVGYLRLDGFMDPEAAARPAAAAMSFLANTDALILDLRFNGGGSPKGVALVCSYLFGATPVHLNSLYWRKGDRTEEFWTLKELAGPRYLDRDVFVLTSKRTFSGAEECAYNLKNLKRAVLVGETTGGGAHPGGGFRINDHFVMFVPTGRAISPITKTNWEGTGVTPDVTCAADKALEVAHQEAVKRLLAKAKDDEARRQIKADLEMEKRREKMLSEK